MGDARIENDGHGEETAAVVSKEDELYGLFVRLLIKRIIGFLEQKPSDFAITILPQIPAVPENVGTCADIEEEGSQTLNDDNVISKSLESLSIEHRSLLESSVVLMHEPGNTCKPIGHLGLEAQRLPQIARIFRKAYRQAKKKIQNASLPSVIETEELFHITSCLLLIQPDHATAWADRRRCLISLQNNDAQLSNSLAVEKPRNSVDEDNDEGEEEDTKDPSFILWSRELDYLDLLFTQHSKAPSSWAHRKFVLRQMLKIVDIPSHGNMEKSNKMKDIIFAREVKTCIEVAERYPKNYYAWTHRRYLWDVFSFDTGSTEHREQQAQRELLIQLLETELMIGMWQEWLPIHPSDHSAVHYACQVLDLLMDEIISIQVDSGQPLIEEKIAPISISALNQVRILLSKYSEENESLWILRRITYKILWKHLYFPPVAEKHPDKKNFFNAMASLVRTLVRNDLKSIVSSTLSDCNDSESDSMKTPHEKSIYVWTFLAWCIANLPGIDGHLEGTNDDCEASKTDIIFNPRIREIAAANLTTMTGMAHHNHLVYTSYSSPIFEALSKGAT